ncbi:MAG: thiazole synthase, partial [Kiritimatiellae bacterium]|nr:thiazole synthase [Kiritimatiellia bacterium]
SPAAQSEIYDLRRGGPVRNLLHPLPLGFNAAEAVRIAKLGKAAGYNWIKIEVHPDARYLLPDPVETLEAVKECAKLGMVVLPYINADPVLARHCEDAGAAAVMPLGSPIGSNRGIRTRDMIEIIVEQSHVPVVVDAGIGLPSHAAEAIELGADAVLANTAVAAADDPVEMSRAFGMAVRAAEIAHKAGPPSSRTTASATSPMDIFK